MIRFVPVVTRLSSRPFDGHGRRRTEIKSREAVNLVRPVNTYDRRFSRHIKVSLSLNESLRLNALTHGVTGLLEPAQVRGHSFRNGCRLSKEIAN